MGDIRERLLLASSHELPQGYDAKVQYGILDDKVS